MVQDPPPKSSHAHHLTPLSHSLSLHPIPEFSGFESLATSKLEEPQNKNLRRQLFLFSSDLKTSAPWTAANFGSLIVKSSALDSSSNPGSPK
jgi:hypothetical protein